MTLLVASALSGCTAPNAPSVAPSNSDMQIRADYLADLASSSGIDNPPDVALVRFVSSEEWAAVQIECLGEAGFDVSLLPDGQGIDPTSIPEGQRVRGGVFKVAQYICEAMYTLDAANSRGLDDDQLGALYDWYLSESVECLEREGISVAPAPSRQRFVESYFTVEGWYPYASVDAMGMGNSEWNALNASCPQSPPDEVLFD